LVRFTKKKLSFHLVLVLIGLFCICSLAFKGTAALGGNIDLSFDSSEIPSTIRPESDVVRISVDISYFVSGLFSELVVPFMDSRTVPVNLSLEHVPEFISADISPDIVYPLVRLTKPSVPEHVIISIRVSPNAPAFQTITFDMVAEAMMVKGRFGRLKLIEGVENKIAVEIIPGYYSNFQYNYRPFYVIGPAETLRIPIEILGFSNARSKLQFEPIIVPENWSATINNEIFLGTSALGEDSSGTVNLVVRSPNKPGIYNEVEQIALRIRTWAAGHPEEGIDNSTILQFTVRCNGSLIEEEGVVDSMHISLQFGLVIIVVVSFFFVIVYWRKQRR
jgi:hypothetical protein